MFGVWTERTVVVGTSPGRIIYVDVNATGCKGPDIGDGRAPLGRIRFVAYTTVSVCVEGEDVRGGEGRRW